jgi:hypothetical protein
VNYTGPIKPGINIMRDNVPEMVAAVRELTRQRVMVGVPDVNAGKGRQAGEPNNATLAYIHDNGAPEANIPARPFMAPGIKRAKAPIEGAMKVAGAAALSGDATKVQRALHAAGIAAESSIKAVITEGIPPPLAPRTVEVRIARRADPKWRAKRRAAVRANVGAGKAPGEGLFTPLIDTGALRASITHVIRKR